jgi:hypothetical protein
MSHFQELSRVDPPPGVDANQAAISLMVIKKYFYNLFYLRQWLKRFGWLVVIKWQLNVVWYILN